MSSVYDRSALSGLRDRLNYLPSKPRTRELEYRNDMFSYQDMSSYRPRSSKLAIPRSSMT
jgi:hypothetical protein